MATIDAIPKFFRIDRVMVYEDGYAILGNPVSIYCFPEEAAEFASFAGKLVRVTTTFEVVTENTAFNELEDAHRAKIAKEGK